MANFNSSTTPVLGSILNEYIENKLNLKYTKGELNFLSDPMSIFIKTKLNKPIVLANNTNNVQQAQSADTDSTKSGFVRVS